MQEVADNKPKKLAMSIRLDPKIKRQLDGIARGQNITASIVATMAIQAGLPQVESALRQLLQTPEAGQ
jgi:predicted transcriptional regulator